MSEALASPATPAAVVNEYLRLLVHPDPVAARRFVAADLSICLTSGRAVRDLVEHRGQQAALHRRHVGLACVLGELATANLVQPTERKSRAA